MSSAKVDAAEYVILVFLYYRWMEVLLPCDDLYMRSVITQRPSYDCPKHMRLGFTVEK